ncbi:MAG: DUF4202 family protein [candidate division KSB1 bacterium]|nr:DUF4202 family protein [candidate division KSB1 bacterium]
MLEILRHSPVPEDYAHALNVRQWVQRLDGQASEALQLAALAHDVERAVPDRKVRRQDFEDYDDFKRAHAENSARMVEELLREVGAPAAIRKRIVELVRHHEFGRNGDPEAALLKDADSLSFFETNLGAYAQREGEAEALRRMRWGYRRLSPLARTHFPGIHPAEPKAAALMKRFLSEPPQKNNDSR